MPSNKLLTLFAVLALSACSLAPRNTGSGYMFALDPVKAHATATTGTARLGIGFPAAAPELDTARIALLRGRDTWDYYAGAKWSDFLPVVVQDNLIETIGASGLFASVAEEGVAADESLKIGIRHFEADYRDGRAAPLVRVDLQLLLVDRRGGRALGAFSVNGTARAKEDSLPAVHAAFRAAFMAAERQCVASLAQLAQADGKK